MSTEFQKDLYKKSGSLLTVWDICIGVGLITLGSGAYIHFKDKKQQKSIGDLSMGSANREDDMLNIKKPRESHPTQKRRKVKPINKTPKPVSEESSDTLSKLGL
jgi:hypothetical protein